ncbi:MAG: ATP-dependent Clp protease ATP-binding subunit [Candidatus Nomurabacteria bacterium]|jgi:ATP-dependent Clp protease ATP-binding subunit ClpC|nr:ATP-dependent Clp protease ATP-binding subunit [Candidatus Nomurabacteria bacterium]
MEPRLDFRSTRAVKARFSAKAGKILNIIAILLALIFFLLGAALLIFSEAIGWVVVSLSAYPLMLHVWKKQDLDKLPPSKNPRTLSDVLDGDLLGVLPENPSPRDLAIAVMKTKGGRFFAARFGISAQYLPDLSSTNPADSALVFNEMLQINASLPDKSDSISSATLTAAIVRTQPAAKQILNVLQLSEDDMIRGAEWFTHLSALIKLHSEPKLTGGVGRDWSFGYIPTLQHFGINLSEKFARGRSLNTRLESHHTAISQMLNLLSQGGRKNVALIGPLGSGKATVVDSFAEKLLDASEKIPKSLQFNQVFSLDATALVAAASGRGKIEQLINTLFVEAYKAKNIILFLNNAEVFFEDSAGSIDVSGILQPILEGSGLRLILSLDEQKFLQIAQTRPALAAALNRVQIAPPSQDDVLRILEDQIISFEPQHNVTYMYQALTETYRLSERYIQDVAQPQKSIQLLEGSANVAELGLVTSQSVRTTIENTLGVKIGGAVGNNSDPSERDKLLNLENLIHQRMINQTNAVSAVSAALRRARAGVRNENRPIGTFLFLGPTGVGKTELAKALADVYFGGENHMVRIDLNEYVRPEDVARLIADGATDPNSLSAQVQKNPFSVVLLDEIEKAHTNVLTTLLQVLDEGILRDINNREISFRDTILIATSNAGAERIRQYIDAGYQVEQFHEQITNELIERQEFRPEFLNRFDEIVVFRPLTKDELVQVVDLILKSINKNLSLQKVAVVVDDEAKRALVDAGYDPRLGARPMRRIVQKTVENIVAEKLLTGELTAGETLNIGVGDLRF